jgi:hypothetical protein
VERLLSALDALDAPAEDREDDDPAGPGNEEDEPALGWADLRLTREHFAVNGGDLMGQRFDLGGTDGEIGIKKVGQTDAVSFGREPQQAAVGVEGIAPSSFQKLESVLLTTIDEAFANAAVHTKYEVQSVRAEARDLHDLRDAGRIEAAQSRPWLDVLKGGHCSIQQGALDGRLAGRIQPQCSANTALLLDIAGGVFCSSLKIGRW